MSRGNDLPIPGDFALRAIARSRSFRHNKPMMIDREHPFTSDMPVILVGASPVPLAAQLDLLPSHWPIIAADGGAAAVLNMGRTPDLILGDMDSLADNVVIPNNVPVITLTGQDDTDFEKALSRLSAPLIIGLGFLEARFDHSLAAIHALMCVDHDRPIMLLGNTDIVLRVKGNFSAALPIGSRFSVWPLGTQSFTSSTGLKWPLDGLTLAPGLLIGTSNEVSQEMVTITEADGDGYAVIVPVSLLPALLNAL